MAYIQIERANITETMNMLHLGAQRDRHAPIMATKLGDINVRSKNTVSKGPFIDLKNSLDPFNDPQILSSPFAIIHDPNIQDRLLVASSSLGKSLNQD